jgi:phosphoglycolate phosphatase
VLFDLDGTLVRSSIDFAAMRRAVTTLVSAHGGDASQLRAKDVLGIVEQGATLVTARDAFVAACEEAIVRIELDALTGAAAFEGALHTLEWLIARGVRVGIVTRNSRPVVTRMLATIPLPHHTLVTRNEAPRPKPDPSHLFAALANLGVGPAESIMVGDHAMDIAGGRAASMRAIGIAHDGATAAFEGTGADAIVTSFAAFRAWLDPALRKV